MQSLPAARRRHAHLALAAALFLAGGSATMLYRFPPDRYGFYPQCPIFALTGWECPGCGMTRALAALVHGHLAEAVRWNPLVLLVLAGMAVWGVAAYRRQVAGGRVEWPRIPNPVVAALLLAVGVFTVARNLTW